MDKWYQSLPKFHGGKKRSLQREVWVEMGKDAKLACKMMMY